MIGFEIVQYPEQKAGSSKCSFDFFLYQNDRKGHFTWGVLIMVKKCVGLV